MRLLLLFFLMSMVAAAQGTWPAEPLTTGDITTWSYVESTLPPTSWTIVEPGEDLFINSGRDQIEKDLLLKNGKRIRGYALRDIVTNVTTGEKFYKTLTYIDKEYGYQIGVGEVAYARTYVDCAPNRGNIISNITAEDNIYYNWNTVPNEQMWQELQDAIIEYDITVDPN